jgi:hypothetical protein
MNKCKAFRKGRIVLKLKRATELRSEMFKAFKKTVSTNQALQMFPGTLNEIQVEQ